MKIWAISKSGNDQHEIGIEYDGADHENAIRELYQIARNLFNGELELFWSEGESGKAF